MRQRDGFHIARAACRAAGGEQGAALRAALQAGAWEQAAALWAQVPEPGNEAPSQQRRAWAWLDRHLHDPRLVRGWHQKGEEGENLETLGHIESQVRALIAHRMKGKGRHWSARGLRYLAKVRQELRNGGLPVWCGRHRGPLQVRAGPTQNARTRSPMQLREDPGAWMQAHLPLLEGPVPTSPALLRLRQRIRSG